MPESSTQEPEAAIDKAEAGEGPHNLTIAVTGEYGAIVYVNMAGAADFRSSSMQLNRSIQRQGAC